MNFLSTDLYERQGNAITNFKAVLPVPESDLAQYAVNSMNAPIGISEFDLSSLIPEDYKNSMPSIEDIEKELEN